MNLSAGSITVWLMLTSERCNHQTDIDCSKYGGNVRLSTENVVSGLNWKVPFASTAGAEAGLRQGMGVGTWSSPSPGCSSTAASFDELVIAAAGLRSLVMIATVSYSYV
jgi:hypothetical protein